jgi:uncharacterized protein (DUF1330 family)
MTRPITLRPTVYAVVEYSNISDPAAFQRLGPKARQAIASAGGRFVVQTETVLPLYGTPPQRFVIVAFDSVDKARAWDASPVMRELNAFGDLPTTSRRFIVEGVAD